MVIGVTSPSRSRITIPLNAEAASVAAGERCSFSSSVSSSIETMLLTNILQKMMVVCMQLMRDPWKNVVEVNPVLDRIETNPAFAQIISPSDMIAIVTLNVKIGDTEGFFNICLPFFTLEDVMDKLNTKFWFSNMTEISGEEYSEYLEAMIRHVDIPIRAVLGGSSISVGEFMMLQPGDVIRVDTDVDSELDVYVGNIRKFTGLPGYNKDKASAYASITARKE